VDNTKPKAVQLALRAMVKTGVMETVSGKMADVSQVPGHLGHPGVVAASRVGRGLPQELVLALLQWLVSVRDQIRIHENALEGIVQWMALGLHGQLGAAAAGRVVLEEPQDIVSACLPRLLLGGNPVREGAKTIKIVKLGNAQGTPAYLNAMTRIWTHKVQSTRVASKLQ